MNAPRPKSKSDELKLLLLSQLFYPELISTGQTLTELCEELVRRHILIKVVCGPPTISNEKQEFSKNTDHQGIQIRRVWGTRFPKLKFWGRLLNQITFTFSAFFYLLRKAKTWPVLVVTNPPFLPLVCSLLYKLQGRPYAYLVFDVYPDTLINLEIIRSHGFLHKLWDKANRIMLKNATAIIPIGHDMQALLVQKYKTQTSGKLHYIPIWCDDRIIKSAQAQTNPYTQKWGLAEKFVVLYSGNMGRFHDMETIIAAAKILAGNPDIVFLFVGEGYKKAGMQRQVQKEGMENCQFHTYVARHDLRYALTCADIGLVSLLPDQQGLSVPSKTLGYMAASLPVIAIMAEDSEIAQIVLESRCGWIIQPGDANELAKMIVRLSERPPQLSEFGANAKAAIEKRYSLALTAEAYHNITKKLNHSLQKSPKKNHNN